MKYTVPFTRKVVDIFEVDAKSRAHAAVLATEARMRGDAPTHSYDSDAQVGKIETITSTPVAATDE